MILDKVFTYLVLVKAVSSFEFIRQTLREIDRTVDPCDDFYRHLCPKGDFDFVIDREIKPIVEEFFSLQKHNFWVNSLLLIEAVKNLKLDEHPDTLKDYAVHLFEKNCNNGVDTTQILKRIQHMFYHSTSIPCKNIFCLETLSGDNNCTRSTMHLSVRLSRFPSFDEQIHVRYFELDLMKIVGKIRVVNALIDGDLTDGVTTAKSFMESFKDIAIDLIKKTPWVTNQGIEEALVQLVKELSLNINYAAQLRDHVEMLFLLESNFLKCMQDVSSGDKLFCLKYTEAVTQYNHRDNVIKVKMNAWNSHPNILLSFPLYFVAGGDDEFAAKIGYVGQILAHEISHTLIENPKEQKFLPYSSFEAIQCIQNQFNATCQEFKEKACQITDVQIDDNGADMLGLELSYKLFADYYADRKDEVYLYLTHANITMEQIFFYAAGQTLCTGRDGDDKLNVHSATNIRVNTMSAHPAFQNAFQCSSESRMMKTVQERCIIYGKDAPQQRKH